MELFGGIREVAEHLVGDVAFHLLDGVDTRVLVLLVERLANAPLRELLHAYLEPVRELRFLPGHLPRTLGKREELFLCTDELTNPFLRDAQRFDDVVFGDLECAAFHHDDGVARPGDHQLHVAVLELLKRGIEHPLPLETPNTNTRDGTREGNLRGIERARRCDQREHVGVILLIGGDDIHEDLHFVLEPVGKEGPNGAVDDASR